MLTATALAAPPTITTTPTIDYVQAPGQAYVSVGYYYDMPNGPSPWDVSYKVTIRDGITGERLGTVTDSSPVWDVPTDSDPYGRWLTAEVTITNPDGSDTRTGDNMPAGPPHIDHIDRFWAPYATAYGSRGTTWSLEGDNIGQLQANSEVYFEPGHIKAEIVSWWFDVEFKIPKDAVDGYIHVTTVKGDSNEFPFEVEKTVYGRVYDGHNPEYSRENPVEDAKVELKDKDSDEVLDTVYTDDLGAYELSTALDVNKKYRVTVTLETKDKRLTMQRGGTTVSMSRDFTNDENMTFPFDFNLREAGKIDDASTTKGDLDNCASVWHWLQRNRQAAKDVGLDPANALKVNVFDSADTSGCSYDLGSRTINIGQQVIDDDRADDVFPPPWEYQLNRETHEFGHAIMHSVMGGWVGWPDRENHAGYINADTGDSLSEGFAEYWAMYAAGAKSMGDDTGRYDSWGYIGGADQRMAWSPVVAAQPTAWPTGPSNCEELAVAGALWRASSALGWGRPALTRITKAFPAGGTLTDWRDKLVAGGVPTSTIDPTLFDFGFFSDVNGNWTRDPGEPVGAGNGADCLMWLGAGSNVETVPPRPNRRNRPIQPNEIIRLELSGVTSSTAESVATVEVTYPGDHMRDFSYATIVPGPTGLLPMPLEAGASFKVTVTGPTGVPAPGSLEMDWDDWRQARDAVTSGPAVTKRFDVVGGGGAAEVSIEGLDRYLTALDGSRKGFPGGADAVILATGANYPDALGASTLAGVERAPILLQNPKTGLANGTKIEIGRLFGGANAGKRIYIAGGTGVVTPAVRAALVKAFPGATVTRLGGADRYATARLIAHEARDRAGSPLGHAIVVSGRDFPDALLAGPVAYRDKRPVLLVAPTQTVADKYLRGILTYCGVSTIDVIGSPAAVSPGMMASLAGSFESVDRPAALADRYAQSVAVARWASGHGLSWTGVGLATGQSFPDALCAGPVLGEAGCPLLLTPTTSLSPVVRSELAAHADTIGTVRFFGGSGAIAGSVRNAALDALR